MGKGRKTLGKLSQSQLDMLYDLAYDSTWGAHERTEKSLLKRGLIEKRGFLEYRLTLAGIEALGKRLNGVRDV